MSVAKERVDVDVIGKRDLKLSGCSLQLWSP